MKIVSLSFTWEDIDIVMVANMSANNTNSLCSRANSHGRSVVLLMDAFTPLSAPWVIRARWREIQGVCGSLKG